MVNVKPVEKPIAARMRLRTVSDTSTLTAEQVKTCAENERKASSIANTSPVTGALKAAARPAEEPAAICNLRTMSERFNVVPTASPAQPPISSEGPSLPAGKPINMQATEAANIEHITVYHLKRSTPRAAPSICGTPLPRIMGMKRVAVPITNAPATSPKNSRGTNAGFSRTRE